jgi:hypothetical protein
MHVFTENMALLCGYFSLQLQGTDSQLHKKTSNPYYVLIRIASIRER